MQFHKMNALYDEKVDMPTAYFTQLLGVALGLPGDVLGLKRLFVPLRLKANAGGEVTNARD